MPKMTDPTDSLTSFQQALQERRVGPRRCELDHELYVYLDYPVSEPRFTYVRLDGSTVTVLVVFVIVEPLDGLPCFQIGYAVPPAYRGKGLAANAVLAAIAELLHGLGRSGITKFCIEAVVADDNKASQRVAEVAGFPAPKAITDKASGKAALQYVLHVGA